MKNKIVIRTKAGDEIKGRISNEDYTKLEIPMIFEKVRLFEHVHTIRPRIRVQTKHVEMTLFVDCIESYYLINSHFNEISPYADISNGIPISQKMLEDIFND